MAAGDVTRTVAKQLPALRPEEVIIRRNPNRVVVTFIDDAGQARQVVAANGACVGWNDNTGRLFETTVVSGFTNAFTAFRTGANGVAATNLVNQLIADGLLVITGTVE